MPDSSQYCFRQVIASFCQTLHNLLHVCYENEVEVGQVTPGERTVASNEEQTVTRNIIGTQGTDLSRRLALFMIDGAGGLIPD